MPAIKKSVNKMPQHTPLTHRRPRQNIELDPRVDGHDILQRRPKVRWGPV
jgi:hypothetical protein